MRVKSILLAGNWKMNYGPKEARAFLDTLNQQLPNLTATSAKTMRLYVPALSLAPALDFCSSKKMGLQIGAQNVHFEKAGAFTGEISVPMLQEIGIQHVLIGHSERRQYFGETSETVMKRTASALLQGMEVLVCIGETLAERNADETESVLSSQLAPLLGNEECKKHFGGKLHIAYEPVWAIGTGVTATPAQAEEAHRFIREKLVNHLGQAQADATRILYGGSVTPANFKELLHCPNIDGGLVGGASLKIESWTQLWNLI